MKKIFFIFIILGFSLALSAQNKAKYVFYIIGDGMGLSQINSTEMYLAELDGIIGVKPLLFTQFPVVGLARTFSASSGVTDSAAAGTALATGSKTKNGTVGLDSTLMNPVYSVATKAKNAGKKVGIVTSCGLDDATPAAFYAHQPKRNMGYEIALDAISSGFDFFGGATFTKPDTKSDGSKGPNAFLLMEEKGYILAYGYDDYKKKKHHVGKMILMEGKDSGLNDLVYAIDRDETNLSLAQVTDAAIEQLTRDNSNGFFLMIEGGTIDMACHANDAATAIVEVIDLNESVKIAYDFYLKHPDETLIIVTADHETGGMVLGSGESRLNLKVLQHQKISQNALSNKIGELRKEKGNNVSWEEIKSLLSETMGLWNEIPISNSEEKLIYEVYENTFVKGDLTKEKSLYQDDEKISVVAKSILNKKALVGWTSRNHSAGFVPIFALGVGAELFNHLMDNTYIPKKIVEVAGY